MPLSILGLGGHPTIGHRSHVYFIDCQVSTYRHISEASESISNGADQSAAAKALGLSTVLFGNSPGHVHCVGSHLLVPLEVRTLNPTCLPTGNSFIGSPGVAALTVWRPHQQQNCSPLRTRCRTAVVVRLHSQSENAELGGVCRALLLLEAHPSRPAVAMWGW